MGLLTLVDRNRAFVSRFDHGDLGIPPRQSTLIVTCVDARVDPAHFLALELGDAFVVRTLGGRVTTAVLEQISILIGLASVAGGSQLEVALIHHTDCGAARFADAGTRSRLAGVAGVDDAAVERYAAVDPRAGVRADLDKLRAATSLPADLVVAGYVYDVSNGRLESVAEPAPLRPAGDA